jgi:hypothetical protein
MISVLSVWGQDEKLASLITSERIKYWARRPVYSFVPACWADVWAAWLSSALLDIQDRGPVMPDVPVAPRDISPHFPDCDLDSGALVNVFRQRRWVFSHRAVYYAARAWEAWDIKRVMGGSPSLRWMNGIPAFSGQTEYMACPAPLPGLLSAMSLNRTLVWHPLVLGPLGEWTGSGITPSPGMEVDESALPLFKFRGEALTDGIWTPQGLIPVPAVGGWFSEQYLWKSEEMLG